MLMLSNEIKQLRQELETLKTLLDETLAKLSGCKEHPKMLNQNEFLKEMEDIVNNCIDQMETKIEEVIEQKISEKQRTYEEKLTFAESLKKNLGSDTIERAIKITKNDENIQETEREKRKNLIIQGRSRKT